DRIPTQLSIVECLTLSFYFSTVNKHKPWIETSYHGVITENMDTVLLDPPLVALDKDAPVPFAGTHQLTTHSCRPSDVYGSVLFPLK
uniref:Uncharacterized protein n=1 Tax=Periophthalmus magnuspinnatus TaxID=409849 RepID=A0A3B3ZH58_9GOBI